MTIAYLGQVAREVHQHIAELPLDGGADLEPQRLMM
jgi:hypothetical protein